MANVQLFQLAQFQNLELKGERVRLQLALWNSHGVEGGGLCQNKTQRRHPHSYFVRQTVLHWSGRPVPATIREVHLCVCLCVSSFKIDSAHKISSRRRYMTVQTPGIVAQRWQGKDRKGRDILYSAPSSPTRGITHWRVTLLVGKISGEPWLKRPACILR